MLVFNYVHSIPLSPLLCQALQNFSFQGNKIHLKKLEKNEKIVYNTYMDAQARF